MTMPQRLEDIQDALLERLHAGEPLERDAILAEHPEHAEALGAFLDLLAVIEDPGSDGALPATLGEFRIVREIGRGGMGIVYEAEQPSLRRRVALKVLPAALRSDPRLVSRFRREAEAAGRLRHPGIVPVFSVGEIGSTPFFVMELIEGRSLDDTEALPSEPGARRSQAVEIARKVAQALSYAHGQGILHRDVKPANILLDPHGEPRLTDFGLAFDMHRPGLTIAGEVFGSPQYMSPEQAVRHEAPLDARTDVYSLAVTLYELCLGRLPYDATTSAELLTALTLGRIVAPRDVDPAFPRALETVLLRALATNPRERYANADAFAADLDAATADRPRPTRVPRSGRHRKLRAWVAIELRPWVAVVVAVAITGIAVLGYRSWRGPDKDTGSGVVTVPTDGTLVWQDVEGGAATVKKNSFEYWMLIDAMTPKERGKLKWKVEVKRVEGEQAARAFCKDWNESWTAQERPRYDALEKRLKAAGLAAAPYLLRVLGTSGYISFGNLGRGGGTTARMQVRALHAVSMLDLKQAIPHVVLHCRGLSLTQISTAGGVLQKLSGESFDAKFLRQANLWKIAWWARGHKKNRLALRTLADQQLRELRGELKLQHKQPGGKRWWNAIGKKIVADLGMLLDTPLPFDETLDQGQQTKQLKRLEQWWKKTKTPARSPAGPQPKPEGHR